MDASLGGAKICNRAQRLFEHRSLLTKSCSDLVIDLMQVGYIPDIVTCSSPSNRLLLDHVTCNNGTISRFNSSSESHLKLI